MRKFISEDPEAETKRSVILFDSFYELLDHNKEKDYRSRDMDDLEFYGANNMQEADKMAREGLPREGVKALNIAHHRVAMMAGELTRPVYEDMYATAGAYVDMGRFVSGEPECMVDYNMVEERGVSKIVALILNISYSCDISAGAIRENGLALMALVEAIETQGMQAEIWTDMNAYGDGHKARTAVKLKGAGEVFDASMFMYALTHPSFLRGHIFNAMHSHPKEFCDAIGISPHGGYGVPIRAEENMDDFPPYSLYIPAISSNSQAGEFVLMVLKALGLTN
ncbi:hypothetical protein KNU44_gp107 [Mycobacterium phage CicholasNage]|uniref:DUF7192 domain-containing protein n=2 Tax=Bronvirus TaxID=1623278 RepID=A0A411BPG7_9CAUD|nr:hypothetical protein KNU44_gp107 [Mycobacterium phage CicholasNage]AEK07647.1 hypothetical protein UPIE_120 [Mycobacterium phage UPIE]AEZ50806.1 hypothetical protein [Mycobacterium phage Fezzik]AZS12266.1 hypothetical protein SEA_ACQUIRE49_121 [Mycobacterium phage Acquire49]QGJ92514.1 hypothetical protein SEA_WYATT2_121 [Mycobacterium phage Wyatt2]QGJ93132.1 hypothetical protein SEA_ZARIA_125 [Mycobacterium phage Zaria]QWT30638.1 hypothetical protein SEA_ROSE5_122 [Mycobacterium phage Rose